MSPLLNCREKTGDSSLKRLIKYFICHSSLYFSKAIVKPNFINTLLNPKKSILNVSFSNDGFLIAISNGNHTVDMFINDSSLLINHLCYTLYEKPYHSDGASIKHQRSPISLAFHPNQTYLFSSGCLGGRLNVSKFTMANNSFFEENIYTLMIYDLITSISFCNDEGILLFCTPSSCFVVNYLNNSVRTLNFLFYSHLNPLRIACCVPNTNLIIFGCQQQSIPNNPHLSSDANTFHSMLVPLILRPFVNTLSFKGDKHHFNMLNKQTSNFIDQSYNSIDIYSFENPIADVVNDPTTQQINFKQLLSNCVYKGVSLKLNLSPDSSLLLGINFDNNNYYVIVVSLTSCNYAQTIYYSPIDFIPTCIQFCCCSKHLIIYRKPNVHQILTSNAVIEAQNSNKASLYSISLMNNVQQEMIVDDMLSSLINIIKMDPLNPKSIILGLSNGSVYKLQL